LETYEQQGFAVSDIERDILKIAVIERYTGNSNIGKGFVKGLGLVKGAIASSVAHDSHNIIVAGANDVDMIEAVKSVKDMGGGFSVVLESRIIARLALPVAGLMSEKSMETVRTKMQTLIAAAQEIGSSLKDPFMTLGFLALPVIPRLKITDKGLVDVEKFEIVDLFEK
jgi:adenine deaminase